MPSCKYCHRWLSTRRVGLEHMEKLHMKEIENEGLDPAKALWLCSHDSLTGRCTCCPTCKEVTGWNSKTGKVFRISNNPECRRRVTENAERNLAKHGLDKHTMMSDMEHQKDMRRKRHTSGKYRFQTDGGVVEFNSTLEENWLMFCDKVLDLPSCCIQDPPETFPYFDPKENVERQYEPDYYMPDYNLMVEIKDGGDKPNSNPAYMEETRYKVYLKDEAMKKQNKYNFIRISGKNYGAFLEMLYNIVYKDLNEPPKNGAKHETLCVITESACIEVEDDCPPTEFEQVNAEAVSFFVKYVGNTSMPQLWGITDSLYKSYWIASDPESQSLVRMTADELDAVPGQLAMYQYRGDENRIKNAFTGLMSIYENERDGSLWDILKILEANGIWFDDRETLANNKHRRCDFVQMSVRLAADPEEGEYVAH